MGPMAHFVVKVLLLPAQMRESILGDGALLRAAVASDVHSAHRGGRLGEEQPRKRNF